MEEELLKQKAGYYGEQSLDYHLRFLPDKKYFILQDLRLANKYGFFQIDTLILSQSFLVILEIKNIKGTIYFDDNFNQLIRSSDGKEEGFSDPLLQIRRQQSELMHWLSNDFKNFPEIPIETFVVISNPSTIIKSTTNNTFLKETVMHGTLLPQKITDLGKKHPPKIIPMKQLKELAHKLKKMHVESNPDLLKRFDIKKSELVKGVYCPKCHSLPMLRKNKAWLCKSCSYSLRDAHIESLKDYALLIGPTITNRQLRDFLYLSSRTTSGYFLKSMNLKHSGNTKGRVYELHFS
ncbi:nuclease-related domain-containing protein [Bacillus gobiensis]|uniref:nuclease-related domain-containing protein n=1 Tax=Bacillus gobiensis TaxID=1441095 RepID=UPI003D1B160B